ncbi:MAG: sugar phosphate isomerase/epimerase [Candidatus Hydrogenedentes bacterium]|nr:sugar phosphate isomerase/epimerase [Candidatus Hydrogenedentota bacterium]
MYVSVRDNMVASGGTESPAALMRKMGVEAVEINLQQDFKVRAMDSHDNIVLSNDADVDAYKARLANVGIRACGLLTARDFSASDMDASIAWLARSIEIADRLGASCVRIDSAMSKERELDFGTRVDMFSKGLKGALDRTSGSKVTLGIENHGFQGNNLAFLLNVYEEVGSDRLGSTMDVGNFYWRGYPLSEVYGILRILAPHTKHTHIKNINYPEDKREITREAGWEYSTYMCPIAQGDIDIQRVAQLLKNAGYTGDLCLEDESLERYEGDERLKYLEEDVKHLQKIAAAIG